MMKIISSVLFFILFTTALGASTEDITTVTSSTSSASSTEVTTASDKTTSSTLESTTTVEPTTTSDVSTTTTPSTTSSSTTIPSSTSDAPTPTASPVPPTKTPEPHETCQFNVTEGGVTCIRAELQAKFLIYVENTTHNVVLGCDASYAGSDCSSNETQTLVLSEPTYTLTMIFEKKAGKVLVNNVTFDYNIPELPRGSGSTHSGDLFNVKAGNSYKCKSKLDIHLDNITMEVEEVHIQAFIEEGKGYGAIQECDADEKVSDIVPIAVGVALAALIIIVLIAYLVGRRRSRQKGYQSV